jgi:hypothetical protein
LRGWDYSWCIRKTKSIKLFLTRKLPRALKFSDILEISHQFCLLRNPRLRDPYSREAKKDIKALSLKLFFSYLQLFLQLVSGIQFCSHGNSAENMRENCDCKIQDPKELGIFSVLGFTKGISQAKSAHFFATVEKKN